VCAATINQPGIARAVACREACCNKKLLLFMLLSRSLRLFMFLGLANSLHVSNLTTFSALDIRPPPTLLLWMICLFAVWAGWISLILVFVVVVASLFLFIVLLLVFTSS
ncbi:hypothetical protein PanWU01x14_136910, partial [Parasponia andersonii]